jgi:uncharacterized cupin superfamily protein
MPLAPKDRRTPPVHLRLGAWGGLLAVLRGPAGAHKLMNRSESPAKTLMFSSSRLPAVTVYPDSDKIGVWPNEEADALIFERGIAVPRAHGEELDDPHAIRAGDA